MNKDNRVYILRGLGVAALLWLSFITAGRGGYAVEYERALRGMPLLKGVLDSSISFRMPLSSIAAAWLTYFVPKGNAVFLISAVIFGKYLLAFNMGKMLYSGTAGLAAVLVSAFLPGEGFEQLFYSFFVLLAGNLLVYRAIKPSAGSGVFAGLAVGGSMLIRSALLFLPFVTAMTDLTRFSPLNSPVQLYKKQVGGKRFPGLYLPFLISSYLFLLPWIFMNYGIHGKFIPFEHEAASRNIITGAMGLTYTAEGDVRSLAGMSPGESPALWAISTVLSHPVVYLEGVFRRLVETFSFHPGLTLLALLSAWIFRKKRYFHVPAVLAFYLFFIHCLMSIEQRYFYPVWQIFAVMTGCLAGKAVQQLKALIISSETPGEINGELHGTLQKWIIVACAAPAFAACLIVSALVVSYPHRGIFLENAVASGYAKGDMDCWLLEKRTEILLGNARIPDARNSLADTRTACGNYNVNLFNLENTIAILSVDSQTMPIPLPPYPSARDYTLKALKCFEFKRYDKALTALYAGEDQEAEHCRIKNPGTEREEQLNRLHSYKSGKALLEEYYSLLDYWPPEKRLEILSVLEEKYPPAKSLLKKKENAPGGKADLQLECAALSLVPGNKKAALKYLEQVSSNDPDILKRKALLYERAGEIKKAYEVVDGFLGQNEKNAGLWLLKAYFQISRREMAAAEVSLKKSAENGLPADEMCAAIVRQQEMKNYPGALKMADIFVEHRPGNAELLHSRGIIKYLLGKKADALVDFEKSVACDPGFLPAYISLAALYCEDGRPEKALQIYEKALDKNREKKNQPRFELIGREKAALAALLERKIF